MKLNIKLITAIISLMMATAYSSQTQQPLPTKDTLVERVTSIIKNSKLTKELQTQNVNVTVQHKWDEQLLDFYDDKKAKAALFELQLHTAEKELIGVMSFTLYIDCANDQLLSYSKFNALVVEAAFKSNNYAKKYLIPLTITVFNRLKIENRFWSAMPLDEKTDRERLVKLYGSFDKSNIAVTGSTTTYTDMQYKAPLRSSL